MQNKYSESINKPNNRSDKIFFEHKENQSFKKVDMNVLLNRVKFEKKNEIKKNLILAAGVVGAISITGLITIL